MQRTEQEAMQQTDMLHPVLETCVERISEGLKELAQQGDWEVVKSVLRVIDAHARAHALRTQGQPARAHLWLVEVGRSQPPAPKARTLPAPLTAA